MGGWASQSVQSGESVLPSCASRSLCTASRTSASSRLSFCSTTSLLTYLLTCLLTCLLTSASSRLPFCSSRLTSSSRSFASASTRSSSALAARLATWAGAYVCTHATMHALLCTCSAPRHLGGCVCMHPCNYACPPLHSHDYLLLQLLRRPRCRLQCSLCCARLLYPFPLRLFRCARLPQPFPLRLFRPPPLPLHFIMLAFLLPRHSALMRLRLGLARLDLT